jgi:hypothetical protein
MFKFKLVFMFMFTIIMSLLILFMFRFVHVYVMFIFIHIPGRAEGKMVRIIVLSLVKYEISLANFTKTKPKNFAKFRPQTIS